VCTTTTTLWSTTTLPTRNHNMPISSLLAGQGEDTDVPSLFSGPGGLLNVEESPFERLIAQARPGADDSDDALVASLIAQEAAAAAAASDEIEDDNRGIIRPRRRRQPHQRPFAPLRATSHVKATMKSLGSSYVTVLAGSLCLLQTFLVWSSFLSNSWADTFSNIPDLPMNEGTILIHSTTPASILSSLAGAQQHGAFLVILLSSLFLPCMCMILCPAWTVTDHGDRQLMTSSTHVPCLSPRFIFESLIRSSYLVVFLLFILDIGTSSIKVVLRNETIVIFSRATGGLLCYSLGIGAALGVVLVLRMSRAAASEVDSSNTSFPESFSTSVRSRSLRIPPPRAFQLPWRLTSSGNSIGGAFGADQSSSQQHLLLDPLLEDDSGANYSNDLDASTTTTPIMRNLQIEDESDFDHNNSNFQRLHYCQKVILYELGTLATVLWLPCLFLPLFQLEYDGLASEFMSNVSLYVRLAHFPILLGQTSHAAGTSLLIQWVLGSSMVLSVYVMPILATVAAVTAWIKPSTQRLCRLFLLYIHPMLGSIFFVLALAIAVPAFGPVLDHVLQEETSGVCEQIQSVTGEACLTISGRMDLGFWCLLVQSISLELFVLLTILWG
jgi:hypothetical protein